MKIPVSKNKQLNFSKKRMPFAIWMGAMVFFGGLLLVHIVQYPWPVKILSILGFVTLGYGADHWLRRAYKFMTQGLPKERTFELAEIPTTPKIWKDISLQAYPDQFNGNTVVTLTNRSPHTLTVSLRLDAPPVDEHDPNRPHLRVDLHSRASYDCICPAQKVHLTYERL